MSVENPINFRNFAPEAGIPVQVRALSGPIKTGAITYDTAYTGNEYARWIYVGTTGDLSYVKWDGTTETLPNLAAGVWHPISSSMINTSGTTIAANQLRWGS
jgi:hypothetical protein